MTFTLIAKQNIGAGSKLVSVGARLQICKNCSSEPNSTEIKKAIKTQLGIDVETQVHKGQFIITKS